MAVMATNKPCTLTMSYPEFMNFTGKRAAEFINGKLAADENGKITALEFDIGLDHGAYSENALGPLIRSCVFLGFPYNIPNVMGVARAGFTNHVFGTAYRGFGSPQAYTCSEMLVDKLACACGMDPFEFRYINVARPYDTCNSGTTYKIYPMVEMMDTLRPLYYEAKERARKESTDKIKRGVGVICGGYTSGMNEDMAQVELELNPDGSVTSYCAWPDMGQGADYGALIHTYEALRPLGLRLDQIHLVMNDTNKNLPHGPAAGSRSHMVNAQATKNAAEQLLKAMRRPDRGYYSYDEMVEKGIPTKYIGVYRAEGGGPQIDPDTGYGDPTREFMILCGFAEVEVDVEPGKCRCIGQTIVSDVGVLGSKLSVEGQAYGGISHTIGYALTEQFEDQKRHVYPLSAGLPQCNEVPDNITIIHHNSFREDSWYGSAGCSENFQNAGHMMIINGIYDAVGVRIYELPALPKKIKAAMDAKAKGKTPPNPPYYLGRDDFYDLVDYLKANPTGGKVSFEG
jgi:aldehyde oxidoreductase